MNYESKLQELLDSSLKIFAQFGYKKATLEEIAGTLNMTKSALYVYVQNKRDLYEKTVAVALTRWQERVKEAVDQETEPAAKFTVLSLKAFQYLSENSDLRKVLIQDPDIFPMFPREDPYSAINDRSRKMLQEILEAGIEKDQFRRVDVQSITWLLFSIYKMFIIDSYIISEKDSTGQLFQEAVDLVMHGLLSKRR
ncbi:MAG: TetR/AcrR family transcriptional regulator [Bacillota bacterium]